MFIQTFDRDDHSFGLVDVFVICFLVEDIELAVLNFCFQIGPQVIFCFDLDRFCSALFDEYLSGVTYFDGVKVKDLTRLCNDIA